MIAMAMACNPKILIADEPTTALDVTIQKQILNLLQKLRIEQKMALILVSHDLGVIAQNTDRILVMYAGEVVEQGPSADVIRAPIHPYTEGLLKCLPALHDGSKKDFRLPTIPGIVPNLADRPPGCQLAPRCSYRQDSCEKARVPMFLSENRQHRCLYPLNGAKVGG
jgi:dipeptide transport system ATP-binding protein